MNIWITGAAGQVGIDCVAALQKFPAQNIYTTDHSQCDITSSEQIKRCMEIFQPDWIINAAAYTAVDRAESEKDLAFAINSTGASLLAQACAQNHAALIHLSTDFVFDGEKSEPYLENDKPNPLNVYAESKWQGELAVREYCQRALILRVSWVFGREGKNFVKTMAQLMQSRDELGVVNDQFGGPTPSRAIADAIVAIISNDNIEHCFDTYHFSGTPAVSWYDFAHTIWTVLQSRGTVKCKNLKSITSAEYPTPVTRPKNSRLNCDKIFQDFGITQPQWRDFLDDILNKV